MTDNRQRVNSASGHRGLQFFPNPSVIELSDPITRMYAAPFNDVTIGAGHYRVLDGVA